MATSRSETARARRLSNLEEVDGATLVTSAAVNVVIPAGIATAADTHAALAEAVRCLAPIRVAMDVKESTPSGESSDELCCKDLICPARPPLPSCGAPIFQSEEVQRRLSIPWVVVGSYAMLLVGVFCLSMLVLFRGVGFEVGFIVSLAVGGLQLLRHRRGRALLLLQTFEVWYLTAAVLGYSCVYGAMYYYLGIPWLLWAAMGVVAMIVSPPTLFMTDASALTPVGRIRLVVSLAALMCLNLVFMSRPILAIGGDDVLRESQASRDFLIFDASLISLAFGMFAQYTAFQLRYAVVATYHRRPFIILTAYPTRVRSASWLKEECVKEIDVASPVSAAAPPGGSSVDLPPVVCAAATFITPRSEKAITAQLKARMAKLGACHVDVACESVFLKPTDEALGPCQAPQLVNAKPILASESAAAVLDSSIVAAASVLLLLSGFVLGFGLEKPYGSVFVWVGMLPHLLRYRRGYVAVLLRQFNVWYLLAQSSGLIWTVAAVQALGDGGVALAVPNAATAMLLMLILLSVDAAPFPRWVVRIFSTMWFLLIVVATVVVTNKVGERLLSDDQNTFLRYQFFIGPFSISTRAIGITSGVNTSLFMLKVLHRVWSAPGEELIAVSVPVVESVPFEDLDGRAAENPLKTFVATAILDEDENDVDAGSFGDESPAYGSQSALVVMELSASQADQ